MTQPTLINLHPNCYIQGLSCYPFSVNLDRRIGSCSILNDTSGRICVSNKTEYVPLSALNVITEINESKRLTK